MQDLTPGQTLASRFTLIRRLGKGSVGEVWLAGDDIGGDEVALKIFRADETGAAGDGQMAAEWQHLEQFEHPNIVRSYGGFDDDGLTFFAMEPFDGGDFRRFVGRPMEVWAAPMLDVLDALAHIHQRGLVHRDLKASNLLLDANGRAAIADFGIASIAGGELRSGGSMYGMSPQQYDGAPPSPADDLHAIGALLYELVTGAPPLYPDITPDRLRAEMPPPPGDGELSALIMSLLAKDPAARPASVPELRQRFASLAGSGVDNPTLPPRELLLADEAPAHVEIRPTSMRVIAPPATVAATTGPAPARAGQWIMAWAMLATLGLVAFAVFVFLPTSVEQRRAAAPRTVAPVDAPTGGVGEKEQTPADGGTPVRVGLSPYQLSQLAAKRERAERELKALLRTQERLEARNVSVWGADAFEAARAVGTDGDVLFRERNYDEAAQKYATAGARMSELLGGADGVFADALDAAWAAFRGGRQQKAQTAFEYALAIDPDNTDAARGLERTQNLDTLVELTNEAKRLEAAGSLEGARARFREALALDADYSPAVEGVDRVGERIADASFNAILSRGFAALERKDFATAREAFTAAVARRPASAAAKSGLEQVGLATRMSSIQSLRSEAQAHVAAERWSDASASFAALLEIDDSLVFAKQGRARAERRAALDRRLKELVDHPERLATDSVYTAAIGILEEASRVPSAGPVLADQQRRLARLIATARTPIQVTLVSDNQTSVVVYKVDRLGKFERRNLNLRPGKYTVVGSREGYRDVRREFTLTADKVPDPVVVRCEEKI